MRRVMISSLLPGPCTLPDAAAHHLRDVLRAAVGDIVEAFDPAGGRAAATVTQLRPSVVVSIGQIEAAPPAPSLVVASAVPKGDRAEAMIEKLCELGADIFIPLRTARSVVHPEGAAKRARWERIAAEAARQSHRRGVMTIEALADLPAVIERFAGGVFLSTAAGTRRLTDIAPPPALLLIGPEGGWTADEEAAMLARGLTPAGLGPTILRIETAATVAAGIVQLMHP